MGPMEIIRIISFAAGIFQLLIVNLKNHFKVRCDLENLLERLRNDLLELETGLEKEGWKSFDELLVTELAYDIEDFAVDLHPLGVSGTLLSGVSGIYLREKDVQRIENVFLPRIKQLLERKDKDSAKSKPEQGGGSNPASSSAAVEYTPAESLVGITEDKENSPKEVILELLREAASSENAEAGGQDAKKLPKVISIVGCPGVGKTALARAVYDHYVASAASSSPDFDCVAWVEAAGCNDKAALLCKILQKVVEGLRYGVSETHLPSEGDDGNATSKKLQGILAHKSYLVIIDDVKEADVLKAIREKHFPTTNVKSGMVIVTTSVRQVADAFSSGSYVYTMKCLDDTDSRNLFCRVAFDGTPNDVSSANREGSEGIITKCGGLPLALISVAEHLSINPTSIDREYLNGVAKKLGSHYLAGFKAEKEFSKLRRALGQCYEGLRNYDHKTYMRSLSIFPWNHPIRCKSLVRRLLAEGLVANDDRECLDELVNRCIVEPVRVGRSSKDVKSFKVDVGIMLEFIIHKSLSTNFVTLIQEEEVMRNRKGRIRRLSVQSSSKDKFQEVALENNNEMSETIRSLTIIPPQERSEVSKIVKSCKFLRLLDLDGCTGIGEEFLKGICKLVYLKYLSLRRTDVKTIPPQIENLRCLQTLDIRDIRENDDVEIELPIQAMTLPELAFLFGKFVLPKMSKKTKEFLERKSKLHTVAGFLVFDKGSEHAILQAKNLRKVKAWCKYTSNNEFVLSLQSRFTSLESLSIESDQISPDIMASLDSSVPSGKPRWSSITSMKLSGKIGRLPVVATLAVINNLSKLQLSNTGLTSNDLSVLQHIDKLEYLNLQDNATNSWDDIFSVHGNGFESLKRLCFQASKLPKLEFKSGSMKSLTSLLLLCQDISQMKVAEEISESIKHITKLNEVILHSSATEAIVGAWKTAAKSNPIRPCVTTSTCS